jgi:hypothetical protein
MEARDADPVASEAAPVHDLHGPLVMGAKIPGGDDGYRQNLRIGDVRTPPVPPARGGVRRPRRSITVSITTKAAIIGRATVGSSWRRWLV